MKRDLRNVVEYLPPPHVVVGATLLESFHPRRRSRLVDNTKLTQRKASHFIATTIAAEEDGSEEEEERGQRKGLKTPCPPGASLYSQRSCTVSSFKPSD